MAYYSSNFYNSDLGEYDYEYEYQPTSYGGGSYDFPPTQALMGYSSYEFSEPQFTEFHQTPYYDAYDSALTQSTMAYSTSNFSEPLFFQYDPRYGSQKQFIISYSTTAHNEPDDEFMEEGPIPYVGGYDITQTYGKPLPPSDEICYPRSMPDPNSLALDGFSNGSIVPPKKEKEEVDSIAAKPPNGIETKGTNEAEQQQQHGDNGNGNNGHGRGEPVEDSNQLGEEREGTFVDDDNHSIIPWSGNGRSTEDYGYDYEKQVHQTPCGYGSDALDLCESLFGYWPCLYKQKDQKLSHGCQEVGDYDDEGNSCDHWKGTTDYIFGNSYPYDDDRRDGSSSGNYPIYGYERHYQEPHQYRQIEYDEHSWL